MDSLRLGDPSDIGGYRLLARLGEGGMGEVFLARTASGRALALKTVHRDLSLEPGFAERFAQEIRTSDRVRSPWTVSVVDFSPPDATPQWLATEYVPAPSLADWVRRHGPLPEPAVRCLARELSAALVAVGTAGVVHRDIKPANVLLGPERPFLIDFGIARAVRDPRRTRTGTVIGTPGYLAPEQATGAVAGAAADVFSLAAVVVHAATGRSPFLAHAEELSLPALLYRVVHDEPVLDGVPTALVPLLKECLAKEPDRRPTADEVRSQLGAAEADWAALAPADLLEDTRRREDELKTLLITAPPPPRPADPVAGFGPPPTDGSWPQPAPTPGAVPPSGTVPPASPPIPLPGASVFPPTTPTPDTQGSAPAPAGPPGGPAFRRPVVIAAAVVGAAALAVAVTLAVRWPGGDGDGSDGAGGSTTPPPASSRSSAPPAQALAASWSGNWSGLGPGTPDADGITQARTKDFAVTVTFYGGKVGDLVGRQVSNLEEVSTGRNLGCTEALELRQVQGNRAVFAAATAHPTDRDAASVVCPQGNIYVVTMADTDRLTLEVEGAQSAGTPPALTRNR
ncbi:serine/threonine-protein kinase [Streptomyces sp. NBC_00239]|uniref:serine/threonine-protein kinase n=1 Tax=Streptomyces sp. NBC_00239 TaxID=2903640 RepID=UPI002E299C3F|nr:serine/threonine-protein kinase [Streptomyces sp. NBC_00239]